MPKPSTRRPSVIGALASLLIGLSVVGLPGAAAAKPAPVPDGISFGASIQAMTSTTHKHLRISLSASESSSDGTHFESADVDVMRAGASENHGWEFKLKEGSLRFSPGTGKGSLTTGSQLNPFATISLKLIATGKKHTVVCHTSRTVNQPVKVTGVFSFDTRSTGKSRWGKVGGSHRRTFKGKSVVTEQFGPLQFCGGATTNPPCISDASWSVLKEGSGIDEVDLSGTIAKVGGKTRKTVTAFRNVSLAKPKGATRFDSISTIDKHMTFSVSGAGLAAFHIGAGGAVTGSAGLVSTVAGSSFPLGCGKKATQTTTQWDAPYKNGKPSLVLHEQIEGNYRMANQSGIIDQDTFAG
jgi:hypothetical protein